MGLEDKLKDSGKNLGKGAIAGAGIGLDPIGAAINGIDYFITGVGPGDKKRAMPTLASKAYRTAYNKDDDVKLLTGYVPRAVGTVGGALAAPTAIAGAGTLIGGPVGGLTALALTYGGSGLYSAVKSGAKFTKELFKGEKKMDKPKAEFGESARYGWE